MDFTIDTNHNLGFDFGSLGSDVNKEYVDQHDQAILEELNSVKEDLEDTLETKADKSEIPTIPTNISAFNNDVGYLTEHQSLSGYATENWVEDQGYLTEHQDISNLATKVELADVESDLLYDLSTKANIGYVDSEIERVENEIPTVPTNVSAFTNDAGYLTQHQSLAGYATENWVNTQGFLKQHQSLDGYATENWVQNQGYLTQHQDISGLATKTELQQAATLFEEELDLKASKTYVDNEIGRVEDEIPTVPTNVSAFTNDAGYGTEDWVEGYVEHELAQYHDNTKQDTLTAGTGISITNNVISATGSGTPEIAWFTCVTHLGPHIIPTFADMMAAVNAGKLVVLDYNPFTTTSFHLYPTLSFKSNSGLIFMAMANGQLQSISFHDDGTYTENAHVICPQNPTTGNYVLKSINGSMQWVAE